MINKQSSNDEVLHHLKQIELMLMTEDEEKGLNKILEIDEILKSPKVEYWIDDGVFSSSWIDDTQDLFASVKKKLLKNHVIKEHLAQCRGFVAYNILLNKLENNDLLLMYQNGQWVFAFLNERKEQEIWVNQRFNSCFFNTQYERKFLELIKEKSSLEIDRHWLFQKESWFYTSDLFEELNTVLSRLSFSDVTKSKESNKVVDDDMPPLDEVFEEAHNSPTTVSVEFEKPEVTIEPVVSVVEFAEPEQSSVVLNPSPEPVVDTVPTVPAPLSAPKKISAKIDENPFEEMPPLDDDVDFAGGLFPSGNVVSEVKSREEIFMNNQDAPVLLDLGFDSVPVIEETKVLTVTETPSVQNAENAFEESVLEIEKSEVENVEQPVVKQDISSMIAPVVINRGISISPVPEKVIKKTSEVVHVPARALFGSKRKVEPSEQASAPGVPEVVPKKKGFSSSLGKGNFAMNSQDDIPFGSEGPGNDDD